MEQETLIIIYVILLVITIVLVVMKKTGWGSLIGVAVFPIYFIFVLWDLISSGKSKEAVEEDEKKDQPVT